MVALYIELVFWNQISTVFVLTTHSGSVGSEGSVRCRLVAFWLGMLWKSRGLSFCVREDLRSN